MLHLPNRPTAAAQHLLSSALDSLREYAFTLDDDDWLEAEPRIARCFTSELACAALTSLLACHQADEVYGLNDYHWLLLDQAVMGYCVLLNDYSSDDWSMLRKMTELLDPELDMWIEHLADGSFKVDAGTFLDIYTPDADFLFTPAQVQAMGLSGRDGMGFRPETWGVVQGLAPHRAELEPREIADGGEWPEYWV